MNWKTTISEIQAFGLTQPQIAAKCGCAQATINDLANEKTKEPRHALGQSLLKLHGRLKARRSAPVISAQSEQMA